MTQLHEQPRAPNKKNPNTYAKKFFANASISKLKIAAIASVG